MTRSRPSAPPGIAIRSILHSRLAESCCTYDIPPYLLSISQDRDWMIGVQTEHDCWISPQYRNFEWVYVTKSIGCLGYWLLLGRKIVLDLKKTQRV